MTSATFGSWLRSVVVLVLITLVALAVYWPAMNRVFVMDQIWYLAELDGSTTLTAGLSHYDYAASRRYWKGDDALFRPLLFVWLAVGNYFFSYHHVWWNLANLALHVLVGFTLFRLLYTIRPSFFALAFTLLFVVMEATLELVVWNHLGGYLLACAFLLIALRVFVVSTVTHKSPSIRDDVIYVLAFTAAVFSHESMVPISILSGILMVRTRLRRPGQSRVWLVASAPVLVFTVAYIFHVNRVERLTYVDRPDAASVLETRNLMRVIPQAVASISRWGVEAALPASLRIFAAPFTRAEKDFNLDWQVRKQLLNVVVVVGLLVVVASGLSVKHLSRFGPLIILLSGAVLAYSTIICMGRPPEEVTKITYYLYAFSLLLVITVYALLSSDRLRGWRSMAAAVAVASLVVINADGARTSLASIAQSNAAASSYIQSVVEFVDSRRSEDDFTFKILKPVAEFDPEVPLREGYPDDPSATTHMRRVTQILFAKYYRENGAKYEFSGK